MILISLQEHFDFYSGVVRSVLKMYPSYKMVSADRVLGLWSIVLSKERHSTTVMKIGLGFLGFINKGACVTRISNGVMFISCHLSAHQENSKKRQEEIRKVFECICDEESLKGIDTVVLAGDMNFRVSGVPRALDYSRARPGDQCNEFRRAYPTFLEEVIRFGPTYKYITGTDELCRKRHPSWCDRVFVSSSCTCRFNTYSSIHSVKISDHKPVVCIFEVDGKRTNRIAIPMVGYNGHLITRRLTRLYCAVHENCDAIAACFLVLMLYLMLARYKAVPRLGNPFRNFCPGTDQ
ncbi:phosphatidylinositol 5-phosphate phosphatase [Encephalitozoon cuniculi EcunIII-L]|nr:phosphatidylinositol 5-phosphate phosphatase [Encephalitozoon cuniculi EcunIII-L]